MVFSHLTIGVQIRISYLANLGQDIPETNTTRIPLTSEDTLILLIGCRYINIVNKLANRICNNTNKILLIALILRGRYYTHGIFSIVVNKSARESSIIPIPPCTPHLKAFIHMCDTIIKL